MEWFWRKVLRLGLRLVGLYNKFHPAYTLDVEVDGRYIADFPEFPGVMAYGASPEEAIANARKLLPWYMSSQN